MRTFLQDLRFASRLLGRNPGLSAVAVLTLALGIGANTAIFSLVSAWVLRPIPFPDPDRLVVLWETNTKEGWLNETSAANLDDWRKAGIAQSLAGWVPGQFNLTGLQEPERVAGMRVSADFFRVMGVAPAMGRDFLPQEDQPGIGRVAVLSHVFWQTHFAADPRILGKTITLDDEPYNVIGVMPANFHVTLMGRTSLWVPLALTPARQQDRRSHYLQVVGRLKPDTSPQAAAAALAALSSNLEKAYPETNSDIAIHMNTLHDEIGKHTGNEAIKILFGIVGVILLIACGNVANLMLSRSTARQKEIAVRVAIGAGRGRLVRQLLTESVLLSLAGAVLGVVLAFWTLDWIVSAIPFENRGYLPNYGIVTVDRVALAYTLLLSIAAGILFGLAPMFQGLKIDVNSALKETAGRVSGGGAGRKTRSFLVAGEIALAMVVLVASTLLIRSFVRMFQVDPGFDPRQVLAAEMELPASQYATDAQVTAFYQELLSRVRSLPQVDALAASQSIPFGGHSSAVEFIAEGKPEPLLADTPGARYWACTPSYLRAMNIPLLEGRDFSGRDNAQAPPVALVNEILAKRYWPGESALGKRIRLGRKATKSVQIVGIVKEIKFNEFSAPAESQIYVPFAQAPDRSMYITVRTPRDAGQIASEIRAAVVSLDRNQPVARVQTLENLIRDQQAPFRILLQSVTFFAGLALFLASIGIYSVMSYSVTQRTQEIGIRMALGAARKDVVRLVVGQGMAVVVAGLAVGLAGALAISRLLSNMLFSITPTDPATFIGTTVLLTAVSLAACYIPARRASRVDPTVSLRYE